ncbi:tryptophan 2,3-dioxygenase family protein [Micromonospora sp. SH-82]|uniref:tryptophan 2,3-dioxygenase family protein n=1 Tax=Micromonospora sp. SH-82 TaxID=3132938 RepID=UPI003EB6DCE9
MRTDELLSLQKGAGEWVHPDEPLFQIVHQSTELWLKLTCLHLSRALDHIEGGDPVLAEPLVQRAADAVRLVTDQLRSLRQVSPAQFAVIRTVLGNGSGFESPGWRQVRALTGDLDVAFGRVLAADGVTAVKVYQGCPTAPLYRLAEALVELDERIALWRTEHYSIAVRIIGHGVLGTGRTPVDSLARLITHRCFPQLWQARTEITETGPAGQPAGEGLR